MPVYIYKCEEHGEFEEEHSIKTKLELCPLCEKENKQPKPIQRLIGSTSFVLNGSCWAKDKYG